MSPEPRTAYHTSPIPVADFPEAEMKLWAGIVAVVSLVLVAGHAIDAQRGGAAQANPLGQPLLDPNGCVKDDAMLKAPARAPEDRKYADLDGRRMRQFLMEVDA